MNELEKMKIEMEEKLKKIDQKIEEDKIKKQKELEIIEEMRKKEKEKQIYHKQEKYNPNFQFENKIPKQDIISKKEAALEVIKWINTSRILSIIAIIIPFVVISLSIMYLDVVALGLWAVISAYVGFLLVKGTRYKNYLINEYKIQIMKPVYGFNKKQHQPQENFIRRY